MIKETCEHLEKELPLSSPSIFEEFDLLDGHPWDEVAKDPSTTYYPCLYGLVRPEEPRKILEVGTGFGMSAATLLKACSTVELFCTRDLGIYGEQLGFSSNNIDFARYRIHTWCCRNRVPLERVRFYRANTQPYGKGDNENAAADVDRWHQIPELVRVLEAHEFDVIFVDGKHTEDGLLNDLITFWPFLRPGGLILCDDLHDEINYKGIFPWAGQSLYSFETFLEKHGLEIADSYVWNFPRVPPGGPLGLRPFGIIRKEPLQHTLSGTPGFEMFDAPDAQKINRARQDHLASLGLDLFNKSVLEVGAGVGWHTSFFEKLGCSALSTDARSKNVEEHRRRYPHRKVEAAYLNTSGSHERFGEFAIVYCYGTLYQLGDPALCLKELSTSCRSLFLLETCVNPQDNGQINNIEENRENPNQSFEGIGCRPGRDWVMNELRKNFEFAYLTLYQPDHPEFPITWPATNNGELTRSIFIASRQPLKLATLSPDLLNEERRLNTIID